MDAQVAAGVVVTVEPVAVSFKVAGAMLGVGRTKVYELVKCGQLKTVNIGDEKVVVESIRSFVAAAARSADQER